MSQYMCIYVHTFVSMQIYNLELYRFMERPYTLLNSLKSHRILRMLCHLGLKVPTRNYLSFIGAYINVEME